VICSEAIFAAWRIQSTTITSLLFVGLLYLHRWEEEEEERTCEGIKTQKMLFLRGKSHFLGAALGTLLYGADVVRALNLDLTSPGRSESCTFFFSLNKLVAAFPLHLEPTPCPVANSFFFSFFPFPRPFSESIKSTASVVAYDLMKYYRGNYSGETVGLLPDPYFWGMAGALFGQMVEYWFYTGDDTYNRITSEALLAQIGPGNDYLVPNQTMVEVRMLRRSFFFLSDSI